MKSMFTKVLLLLGIIGLVLAIAGCGKKDEEKKAKDESPVTYVQPQNILEKIDKKETFVFVIGSKTCSACQNYKATSLKEMSEKDGVKLPFIDIYGIENKEKEFADIQKLIKDHLKDKFEATPTTYYMEKGKLKEAVVGDVPYKDVKEKYDSLMKKSK